MAASRRMICSGVASGWEVLSSLLVRYGANNPAASRLRPSRRSRTISALRSEIIFRLLLLMTCLTRWVDSESTQPRHPEEARQENRRVKIESQQSAVSKGDLFRSSNRLVSPLESPSAMRKESSFETPPYTVFAIMKNYSVAAPSYDTNKELGFARALRNKSSKSSFETPP